MSHGTSSDPANLVRPAVAASVAETMKALASPTRLRILGLLESDPCSVNEIADRIQMEASAVSHQLRVLRLLGLVVNARDGRRIVYTVHDEHVGQLLAEAMSHVEHIRSGLSGAVANRVSLTA